MFRILTAPLPHALKSRKPRPIQLYLGGFIQTGWKSEQVGPRCRGAASALGCRDVYSVIGRRTGRAAARPYQTTLS